MSQNFDLGPNYILMISNVNNNENNIFLNFYIT